MACVYFFPIAQLELGDWIHAPRLPLGAAYRGVCRATSDAFEPPESEQRELCNCGYARGRCGRMPADAPDAIRFSVTENRGDLQLRWVIEKDHMPVEFGSIASTEASLAIAPELLAAQARAFIQSHGEMNVTGEISVTATAP